MTVVGVGLSVDQLVTFDIPMTVNPGQVVMHLLHIHQIVAAEVLADFEALIKC